MKEFRHFIVAGIILGTFTLLFTFSEGKAAVNTPGDEDYLAFAEEMPAPVNGMAGIISKIVYPSIAKQAKIEGKVFLLAYIDEKGSVQDVKVLKGIGGGCDEAAMDVVKKTKFSPGKNKGATVKVKMSLAITFKL